MQIAQGTEQVINYTLQPTQWKFFASPADIIIFGGGAGGGKSYGLQIMALEHCGNPSYRAIIFRRKSPEITNPGGLWDLSNELYLPLGSKPKLTDLTHTFPGGSVIKFSHMQHVKDRFNHKGGQYAFVGFDEVDTFEEIQWWYLLSRMRSMSGIKPLLRATCNPDADSWVAKLIAWWIDQDTGYPIAERSGVIRWFVQRGEGVDGLVWFESREAALAAFPHSKPKSFTFIPSKLEDNRALMEADPDYESNLEALGLVERERLLNGNWKIRPAAGLYFKRSYFGKIKASKVPKGLIWIRYWDLASTKEKIKNAKKLGESQQPCFTAGALLAIEPDDEGKPKRIFLKHVERFRGSPKQVEKRIKNIAEQDGQDVYVAIEKDPGAAGDFTAFNFERLLEDFALLTPRKMDNKIAAASPVSRQAEDGKIYLVSSGDETDKWHDEFLNEAENFPDGRYKDQIDAFAGAYNELKRLPQISVF